MKPVVSPQQVVQRVWQYANVLKDDGLAFMDYAEQITYLLFLKLVSSEPSEIQSRIPSRYSWGKLKSVRDDSELSNRYHQALRRLSEEEGLIGLIFAKPQSKITDPAKLRLLIDMIDKEDWGSLDFDLKGEIYEGLLARNAEDVRGGAGQYFTPRPVVRAIVEVMAPQPSMRILDPSCGTGGFLLAAFDYMKRQTRSAPERRRLESQSIRGVDLVPNVVRLCAMNLFLRGIGSNGKATSVRCADSLSHPEPEPADMVLTNPPFGRKSSFTIVGRDGRKVRDQVGYARPDFLVTTSNKQLNFLQHAYSALKDNGKAAIVVPDNVLFEGGAGEKVRRELFQRCRVHTLLRLPVGIWYSPGVQANVLFFDRCEKGTRQDDNLWIYDLRSGANFSLRNNPIQESDLVDFVKCYRAGNEQSREESSRFRRFTIEEILRKDGMNLDISWPITTGAFRVANDPQEVLGSIVADLTESIREFSRVEELLRDGK